MKKTILPLIAIVGNASIARALSERFTGSKYYFAIMEEPWVLRPDAKNEIIRRNNLLHFIQHEYLILADCGEKTRELFMKHFPRTYQRKVIVIEEEAAIDKSMRVLKKYLNKSTVDKQYIDLSELEHLSTSEQIAVIEKSGSIGEVIAENFCIANGYKILKAEKVTKSWLMRLRSYYEIGIWQRIVCYGKRRKMSYSKLLEIEEQEKGVRSQHLTYKE